MALSKCCAIGGLVLQRDHVVCPILFSSPGVDPAAFPVAGVEDAEAQEPFDGHGHPDAQQAPAEDLDQEQRSRHPDAPHADERGHRGDPDVAGAP